MARSLLFQLVMPTSDTTETPVEPQLARLHESGSIRQRLPGGGILAIDRALPFLLVYRHPPDRADAGTARLLEAEASYLIAGRNGDGDAAGLVRAVAEAGRQRFGSFLVLELWSAVDEVSRRFVVRGPDRVAPEAASKLVDGLRTLSDLLPELDVKLDRRGERHAPGFEPLLSVHESWKAGTLMLGLEVPPVYRDATTGTPYPRLLHRLRRRLSPILRQAVYEFVRVQTSYELRHYHSLGTRSLPDMVWCADRELSAIEHAFDFLLLTSPINDTQAWRQFRDADYMRNPVFRYRLLPMDPDRLKRRLYDIRIEEIDDPALADLFQDKREQLDTQLTMLGERNTPGFRLNSMRMYGTVDDALLSVAQDVLADVTPPTAYRGERVDAWAFRDAAQRELEHYESQHPDLDNAVVVRPDIVGLLVSEGDLYIGERLGIRPDRLDALIHHEVGTHMLTYVNGRAQPLEQLSLGLADYDELQEGMAVLAEYLAGGLDRARMRLLAGRVIGARAVEHGADFVETYRLLTAEYGFSRGDAWHIAQRAHECGGLTRDVIYLRGLVRLLEYLATGGELEPLYVGKIAQRHVPVIAELRHRGVLREPPLRPRLLEDDEARQRFERVRQGIHLVDMIRPETE